jgi:hypothetical protein
MNTESNKHTKKNPEKGGSKVLSYVFSLLDGSFLTKEATIRNLPFALLLFGLAIIYIYMSHSYEKKVREYNKISYSIKDLQSEYISLKSELTYKSNQSQLANALARFELKESKEPPKKLIRKAE